MERFGMYFRGRFNRIWFCIEFEDLEKGEIKSNFQVFDLRLDVMWSYLLRWEVQGEEIKSFVLGFLSLRFKQWYLVGN